MSRRCSSPAAAGGHGRGPISVQRPCPPACTPTPAELVARDVSDVTWLGLELRWLAHNCPQPLRASLTVELVQLGESRQLEVAFGETPADAPPPGWTVDAEHIWRLDQPHSADELAAYAEHPPILPALVTLGVPDHGQLYLNLEAAPGSTSAAMRRQSTGG